MLFINIRGVRCSSVVRASTHGKFTYSHYSSDKTLVCKYDFWFFKHLQGRKEMFYLTTHSTHFIYGYMTSDIWYRTTQIVREETRCHNMGYSFRLTARVLLYATSHRQGSTYHSLYYTSRGALAGSIRRPITPWANALTTELHLAPKTFTTYCMLPVILPAYWEWDVATWKEQSLMVWWVIRSIPHGEPIQLFLIPASVPRLVSQRPWYVLSCLWDDAYTRNFAAKWKE